MNTPKFKFPHELAKARVLKFEKKVKLSPLNNFKQILSKPVPPSPLPTEIMEEETKHG